MKWLVDWILPLLIIAAGLGGAFLLSRARPEVATSVRVEALPVVALAVVTEATGRWTVHSQGTVKPRREVRLDAEVSGRVIERSEVLRAGGFVTAGERLLRLDPRDHEFAIERARAEIAQAEVALQLELAEAEVARDEWSELGDGEASGLVLHEPQIAGAQARLAAARAILARSEVDLERSDIRAPFTGRVRSENVELGQFLAPGEELCVLYGTDVAEVRLPVPDSELAALVLEFAPLTPGGARGPEVVLNAEFAGAERTWRGRIVRTSGEIDSRTRMVHLIAEIRDPYAIEPDSDGVPLTVGMFVRAEILGNEVTGTVEIPRTALWSEREVLVVDDANHLTRRTVEVVRTEGERVFIASGLVAGERLCVTPLASVTDGMLVAPIASGPVDPAR